MLIVDREEFRLWTEGILLQREGTHIVVGDNVKHEAAEKALDRGEVIGLTIDSRLVSYLQLVNGKYVEVLAPGVELDDNKTKER